MTSRESTSVSAVLSNCTHFGFIFSCFDRVFSCSVPCHKKHKEDGCSPAAPPPSASNPPQASPISRLLDSESEDGMPKIPSDVLARLNSDPALREMLKSDRLRETLRGITTADDPYAELDAVMRDPDFVPVADLMLSIVNYRDHLAKSRIE